MTDKKIRWGIIGPGSIAKAFRGGVAASTNGTLVAIATRNPEKPSLAQDFPGVRVVKGYEALLADPEVDAVYIAVPHTGHAEWAIKAAEAGKHVLVEKPLALSAHEQDAVFHAHKKAGTFAGEAFMYRLHPQTAKIIELIRSGAIGDVRMIQSSFGFSMGKFQPEHRLFASKLAGGGIMDVGCYPVSMSRLIAGAAAGKSFLDPVKVSGTAKLNAEGTDDWAAALLTFENGIVAQVSCAVMANLDNVLRIHGSEGRIEVPDFWFAGGDRDQGLGKIDVIKGGKTETISVNEPRHVYSFEAEAAGAAILAGKQEFTSPGMSWGDSLGNARVLDAWRRDAGIEFVVEKPAHRTNTLDNRTLGANSGVIPSAPFRASPSRLPRSHWASRTSAPSPRAPSCSTPSGRRAATCSTPPSSTMAVTRKSCSANGIRAAACANRRC